MELLIRADGNSRCVYSEAIDLSVLGKISIQRGSHVEPDQEGKWTADLSPVNGPQLGPFTNRSEALNAEMDWLREHWLVPRTG
ncbi:hypothetical protein [Roseiconus lacunae]|uniref:hypothetical protein n=1 Tax=Roseiconus lacunae TaxID=2605694 RepID=UPI001E32DF1F|nr:hypothetical protein [Roseiconus lacunae]MCD0462159.1 hypothetical protein [Roseiconus lacunae]